MIQLENVVFIYRNFEVEVYNLAAEQTNEQRIAMCRSLNVIFISSYRSLARTRTITNLLTHINDNKLLPK